MSVLFYEGVDHMIEKITALIKGKANNSHKHTKSDITDFPSLGTASAKDVASSGNASTSQVVMGNDTRLTDARKASDVSAWAKASTKPSYTKSEVGLGNVDNTSDKNKPVSTAQQTAIDTAYANANKYTDKKVADLIGSAPETMDTLEEVAAAIQENKDVEKALNGAIGKKANQTELDTHTGNSTIHITASERTNWNAAKTHADSAHARTDATKVEKSTTNGNIKINGTETTVYTHPGSGTNPHGTTKSDVGLGNVGNFKAVSTLASQGLTDTEKSNARANIGAQVAGSYASSTHNHDDKYQAKGSYASASHTHDLSTMINGLSIGTDTPSDADYYVSQYAGGGDTTTTYHRRPVSALWSYIKGKADKVYAAINHTHTKSQITDLPTKVSELQNDSNYQTDTDVTNAIDDIHIGGKNMCIGTNQGIKNWGWSMETGTCTTEEVLEDGIRTCKMMRGDDAQSGWSAIYFKDISRDRWLPNTDYIITVEVKSNVNATFTLYGLAAIDGSGNLSSKIDVVNNKTKSGEWVTLEWLCKTRNPLPTQTNQLLYMNNMNSKSGVYYQFRNLKIEKGNKATDWTPAPEDIEEEIQKVDNKLTTNLLHHTLSTFTKNGVTCTNNGDGTYTFAGTATNNTNFVLANNIIKNKLSKNLPLKLLGGISNNVYVAYVNMNDENKSIVDKGTGAIINDVIDNGLLSITILAGETLPNIVVKPMLTTNLNATYDDFVQYTGDSGKLNGDVADLLNNLGNASYKDVSTSVISGDSNLVTGDAVSSAIGTIASISTQSWTPNFYRDETHAIGTNMAVGVYYKIGKLVYIRGYVELQESSPCYSIKGLPLAISSSVSIPLNNLLNVSISKYDSNMLNVGRTNLTEIRNVGYNPSDKGIQWIIEGWYITT